MYFLLLASIILAAVAEVIPADPTTDVISTFPDTTPDGTTLLVETTPYGTTLASIPPDPTTEPPLPTTDVTTQIRSTTPEPTRETPTTTVLRSTTVTPEPTGETPTTTLLPSPSPLPTRVMYVYAVGKMELYVDGQLQSVSGVQKGAGQFYVAILPQQKLCIAVKLTRTAPKASFAAADSLGSFATNSDWKCSKEVPEDWETCGGNWQAAVATDNCGFGSLFAGTGAKCISVSKGPSRKATIYCMGTAPSVVPSTATPPPTTTTTIITPTTTQPPSSTTNT